MGTGLYKSGNGWAKVRYQDGTTLDVPLDRYTAAGHEPDFHSLPSEEEYRRNNPSPDDKKA